MLLHIKETGWERMDWINLAQDKDKWQELVNLQVPQNLGNFLTSGESNSSSGTTCNSHFMAHINCCCTTHQFCWQLAALLPNYSQNLHLSHLSINYSTIQLPD